MVREARITHREVSPLELFFDLVFVLAIGQLTHHPFDHGAVTPRPWRRSLRRAVSGPSPPSRSHCSTSSAPVRGS
ncbi:low temperature requirement protein A [Rhodococcus sp. WB9]|uniref:low temperature requirement protein A n=1 Tax=Rhodococcus sp. WB9 TaxID=2594007 RepID=UPI0028C46BDA|nr:low temperature requirement protein A [Rhodococcus sp. WB9]